MMYHLVTRDDWMRALARGVYSPPSLNTEGFIHASHAAQILDVANGRFKGQADLVLLCIDPSGVAATIREDAVTVPGGQTMYFPHIYGPLETKAVVQVFDLPPTADGTFALPAGVV